MHSSSHLEVLLSHYSLNGPIDFPYVTGFSILNRCAVPVLLFLLATVHPELCKATFGWDIEVKSGHLLWLSQCLWCEVVKSIV